MRRATPPLTVLAAAVVALGGLGAGCSREANPPVAPTAADEPPPLPSASGSPIGFLLEEPGLALSDDQRGKLKDIDTDLAGKLADLDNLVRNAGTTVAPARSDSKGGAGFSATAGSNDLDYNKVSAPDATGAPPSTGGLTPAQVAENRETVKRVPDVRARDIRAAVAKALALLGREQQKLARKVLIERGVDPDTGQFEAKGEPGSARDRSK
jgi:hypothetical protein